MDRKELEQLVRQGGSETLEFKKSTAQLRRAMETLCGMLNGAGRRVLIGVTPQRCVAGQGISDETLRKVADMFRHARKTFQHPPPDRTLREDLLHLKRLGLVESDGFGRGAVWRLKREGE